MYNPKNHSDKLTKLTKSSLEQAKSLEDLRPFLLQIGVDRIRSWILSVSNLDRSDPSNTPEFDATSTNQATSVAAVDALPTPQIPGASDLVRKFFYECLSITDILDEDVMQHILSFTLTARMNNVCKTFRKICFNNMNSLAKKMHDSDLYFEPAIVLFMNQSYVISTSAASDDSAGSSSCNSRKNFFHDQLHLPPFETPEIRSESTSYECWFVNPWFNSSKSCNKSNKSNESSCQLKSPTMAMRKPKERIYTHMTIDGFLDFLREAGSTSSSQMQVKVNFEAVDYAIDIYVGPSFSSLSGWYYPWRSMHRLQCAHSGDFRFRKNYGSIGSIGTKFDQLIMQTDDFIDQHNNNGKRAMLSTKGNGYYDVIFEIESEFEVFMKNLIIDTTSQNTAFQGTICLNECSKLWMENCVIKTGSVAINVFENSSLFIENCQFIGGDHATSAVKINPLANDVLIKNCTFEHFGNEPILGYRELDPTISIKRKTNNQYLGFANRPLANIHIISNRFSNNGGFSVALSRYDKCKDGEFKEKLMAAIELRDNEVEDCVGDPNIIQNYSRGPF